MNIPSPPIIVWNFSRCESLMEESVSLLVVKLNLFLNNHSLFIAASLIKCTQRVPVTVNNQTASFKIAPLGLLNIPGLAFSLSNILPQIPTYTWKKISLACQQCTCFPPRQWCCLCIHLTFAALEKAPEGYVCHCTKMCQNWRVRDIWE